MHPECITQAEKRELFLTLLNRYVARRRLSPEVRGCFSSDTFLKAFGDYGFDKQPREFLKQLSMDSQSESTLRGGSCDDKAILSDLYNLFTSAAYVLCELRALWGEGFCCEVHLDEDGVRKKSIALRPRKGISVEVFCELLKDYIDYNPDAELLGADYLDETVNREELSRGLRKYTALKTRRLGDPSTSPALKKWLQKEEADKRASKATKRPQRTKSKRSKRKEGGCGCLILAVLGLFLWWFLAKR